MFKGWSSYELMVLLTVAYIAFGVVWASINSNASRRVAQQKDEKK